MSGRRHVVPRRSQSRPRARPGTTGKRALRRVGHDLLWILALGLLAGVLFAVGGVPQWLQQRLSADEPNGLLWRVLPLLWVWALLLAWYAGTRTRLREEMLLELQKLRESKRRFAEVAGALAEGLFLFDVDGSLLYMNPEAERLLGWTGDELANRNIHQLIHRHEQEPVPPEKCGIQRALTDGRTHRVEEDSFIRKDGSRLPVAYAAAPMLREGRIVGVVTVFEDISERKRLREELEHLATHDTLTGLLNRGELERLLLRERQRAERYGHPLAVLMLDIDHFKAVNDTYGHRTGDAVLKAFAARLAEHARSADVVARYGGEEFVLLLPETSVPAATAMAERLRASLNEAPIEVAGIHGAITASIGVAGYPAHGTTEEQLLRAADEAMYTAKKDGRNRVHTAVS
jgi:diguanylate cyclase (GGDEF)-like protein/PAS domain S-box-containing protein